VKVTVHKAAIPSIAGSEWERLNCVLRDLRGHGFMPHDLANRAGLRYRTALAVAHLLGERMAVDRTLCVYHVCAPHPVAYRKFQDGFQPTPWECPECEELVVRSDELTYDIRCTLIPDAELEFV
jgi:hypothetical protein